MNGHRGAVLWLTGLSGSGKSTLAMSLERLLFQRGRQAFVLEGWRDVAEPTLPPLLKGYLRLGAGVCGAPAWDPAFRTADLLIRLDVARANPRYVDRLLRAA